MPPDLPDSDPAVPRSEGEIPLHRAMARITRDSIAVRQTRAGLIGPLIEAALTLLAVFVMITYINALPLAVLVLLLLLVIVLGPLAVIGFVNNVAGTSFLMERAKYSARWQQGLLGLGLGTYELVPFNRIQRFAVLDDYDDVLGSGIEQDIVHFEVILVKDNDRELAVGSVIAARALAHEAGARANRLAEALAAMSGAPVEVAELPPQDLAEAAYEAERTAERDAGASGESAPRYDADPAKSRREPGRRRYRRAGRRRPAG
jgi:ABC-type multidrug transport system fused ATPase/permease subunit